MVGGEICIFQRTADGGVIEEMIGIYAGTSISGLAASSNSRSESVFIFFFAISVLLQTVGMRSITVIPHILVKVHIFTCSDRIDCVIMAAEYFE